MALGHFWALLEWDTFTCALWGPGGPLLAVGRPVAQPLAVLEGGGGSVASPPQTPPLFVSTAPQQTFGIAVVLKNQKKSSKMQKCVWAYDLPVFCPAEAVEIVKIIKIIKFN